MRAHPEEILLQSEDRILHPARPLSLLEASVTSLWLGILILLPVEALLLLDPLFSAGAGLAGYLIVGLAVLLFSFILIFSHNFRQRNLVWEEGPEGFLVRKKGRKTEEIPFGEIMLSERRKELPGRSRNTPCEVLIVYRKRTSLRPARDFRILLPVPEAEALETRIRERMPEDPEADEE